MDTAVLIYHWICVSCRILNLQTGTLQYIDRPNRYAVHRHLIDLSF
jgi:hypothetical protein